MRHVFLCLTTIFMTPAIAHAQDCDSATDQQSLDACASQGFEKSDAALNEIYKQISSNLANDPDKKAMLVAAQRNWIAFRDSECAFAASGVAGGSVYPMIHAMCLDSLTQARTEQLSLYTQCEEGDLSCPVPASN